MYYAAYTYLVAKIIVGHNTDYTNAYTRNDLASGMSREIESNDLLKNLVIKKL